MRPRENVETRQKPIGAGLRRPAPLLVVVFRKAPGYAASMPIRLQEKMMREYLA